MKETKKKYYRELSDGIEEVILDTDYIAPKDCNSYIIVERTAMLLDGEWLFSQWHEVGKKKFIGKVIGVDQVRNKLTRTAIQNNGKEKVIVLRNGTLYPYSDDIEVVES